MSQNQENPQRTHGQGFQTCSEAQGLEVAQVSKDVEETFPSSSHPLMPSNLKEAPVAETTSTIEGLQNFHSLSIAIPATSSSEFVESSSSEEEEDNVSTSVAVQYTKNMPIDALDEKVAVLVDYMLLNYQMKEPIRKADMLKMVIREHEDHFPKILLRASEYMEMIFGLDVKEVDPINHCYGLFIKLGLTYDGMLSGEKSVPKTGLLILVLSAIFMKGNRATAEEIWEVLNVAGMYSGRKHVIFENPRELITKEFVKEKYLEYQQVGSGDPVQYEFRWGPRAHAETSKMKVLEFVAKTQGTNPSNFPFQYEEALLEERERALARI